MTERPFDVVIRTPLPDGWRLGFHVENGRVASVAFLPADTALAAPRHPDAKRIAAQFRNYFDHPRGSLGHIPLTPAATPFQARIREALMAIPPGETRSYGALADELHSAARAVAGACRANPVPLVVPCHRVVSRGGLGGFMGSLSGAPIALKAWLLEHERT